MITKCICGVLVSISAREFAVWKMEHAKVTGCTVENFEDLEEVKE